MKKVVLVLALAMGVSLGSCEGSSANDDYCIEQADQIRKRANAISADIEAGIGNLNVHQIRLRELQDDATELQKKCN